MCAMKRILIFIITSILIMTLSSCLGGETGVTTHASDENDQPNFPENDDQSDQNNDKENNGEDNKSESKDGLSADGTYYQLTDKDGVIVRVPIGVPLSAGLNGEISWETDTVKERNDYGLVPLSLTTKLETDTNEEEESKSIYVFSPLSVISFGYGNIKHPAKDTYLTDPSGAPYTADEEHVLVVQCFDEKLNAVAPEDPSAYYVYAFILDYKTHPGFLMFSEIIEYSYNGNTTYSYNTFHNVVFGKPYVDKQISTEIDPNTGEEVVRYIITEEIALQYPGLIMTKELKRYECNPDWSVKSWQEYLYDSEWRPTADIHYDSEDRVTYKALYNENGAQYAVYSYEYHINGKLKLLSEPNLVEEYDENGAVIASSKRTEVSPGNYIWDDMEIDELGRVWYSVREYVNDTFVKETQYYADSDVIWIISKDFDENGVPRFREVYNEQGILFSRTNYEYKGELCIKESSTVYNFDGSICSEHEIFYEAWDVIIKEIQIDYLDGKVTNKFVTENYSDGRSKSFFIYNGSGKLTQEMHYSEDGTKSNSIVYDDNGDIIAKSESVYAADVLIQCVTYFYDNGRLIEKTVCENYADGSQKSSLTYDTNGNLITENHWDQDGKAGYSISYDDSGRIVSRSESVNGLLVKQEDYLYENGVHMHTITTTFEYKSDGSLYCRETYHDNILFDKLYLTDDGGMILYQYVNGTVTYFDPAGNIIKTDPISN